MTTVYCLNETCESIGGTDNFAGAKGHRLGTLWVGEVTRGETTTLLFPFWTQKSIVHTVSFSDRHCILYHMI